MSEETQSFPGTFCEPCNKWRAPDAVMPDGSCPKCGTDLGDPGGFDHGVIDGSNESVKIPWHFWVMVAATTIYLGWRVIQGLQSLF